ncbi:MAG: uroporphyrinogen-III C-methyltransferase [Rhodocyclaceae bacterium]|nr:uroporphyrinogen-III C-methyltransferase [Rhodocyclaceae bacterium]
MPGHIPTSSSHAGTVYLVGGGPGDPDLLTLRAARLIGEADVIVYDNLVGKEILGMVRKDAEMHYVGKQAARHSLPQEDINRLLVTLAQQGKSVVRLKGGDPFIFGRGGEEIEELVAHGIPFQVVPGVTAAAGMGAYTGIPLTHRDYAQTLIFATGHLKDGSANLDWQALARPGQTLVIYMGVGGLEEIAGKLITHGLPADTPAAVVHNATLPTQQTVTGTLSTLPALVQESGIKPPALVVIGKVVSLQSRLNWFVPNGPEN